MSTPDPPRGHRSRPHTADVILEAWGPDLPTCCEEGVAALVETYLAEEPTKEGTTRQLHLDPAVADRLLLALLDEVIYALDVGPDVPVGAAVRAAEDDGLDVTLRLAPRTAVEGTGAVPKAISRHELQVVRDDGFRCRFLVDV